MRTESVPVVVVGGGSAAFEAAVAAKQAGAPRVVMLEKAPAPEFVRYGWSSNPLCNLYNKEGLPASPFQVAVKK